MSKSHIGQDKHFWFKYFIIRIFYFILTVEVITGLTTLGDTSRWLSLEDIGGDKINSTVITTYLGNCLISLGNPLMGNFLAMLFSFFVIRWAVDELKLREKMNNSFLLILISLPSFCIWTSIFGKEIFGLCFSAIIGVLVVHFMQKDYTIRLHDVFGILLCYCFKPQYLPFILQGLVYLYIVRKFRLNSSLASLLGFFVLFCNFWGLYLLQNTINELSFQMYDHFSFDDTSTRENIFLDDGDFFRHAPYGMLIAFCGPTFSEMKSSFIQCMAGLESSLILFAFAILIAPRIFYYFRTMLMFSIYDFTCLFVLGGILLSHYPFGIFNPGSAIRYRTNFIFLFTLILIEVFIHFKTLNRNQNC